MKAKLLAVGALAAALLIAGAPLGTASASSTSLTTQTTRIMLAGDSITQGRDGDYTWRYRFAMELKRQGITGVDLVGPNRRPRSYGSPVPHYLANGWDMDHDATSGTTLAYQVDHIRDQVATFDPDILVSYLGTNDFLRVHYDHQTLTPAELLPLYEQQVATTLDNWKTYLDNVRKAKPTVKIVLAELVSTSIPESIRDEYNAKLNSMAAGQWYALGSPIQVTQLAGSLWSSTRYLYDHVHPTPTAETFLAQRISEALVEITKSGAHDYGIFNSAPQIDRSYVAWNPPLSTKAQVTHHRITLNWSFAALYDSATAMRVRFSTVRTGRVQTTPFRAADTWTSPVLKPGTYRIQLQAQRVMMSSTWGQVYVVKVPKPKAAATKR